MLAGAGAGGGAAPDDDEDVILRYAKAKPVSTTVLPEGLRSRLRRLTDVSMGRTDPREVSQHDNVVFYTIAFSPTGIGLACLMEAVGDTPFVVLFAELPPGTDLVSRDRGGARKRGRSEEEDVYEPRTVLALWLRGDCPSVRGRLENPVRWVDDHGYRWMLAAQPPVRDVVLCLAAGNPWFRYGRMLRVDQHDQEVCGKFVCCVSRDGLLAMQRSAWFEEAYLLPRGNGELRILLKEGWSPGS